MYGLKEYPFSYIYIVIQMLMSSKACMLNKKIKKLIPEKKKKKNQFKRGKNKQT